MIRFLTAGESHGPELTTIVEGFPAGISIDYEAINRELTRRQQGSGSGPRMKIESDTIEITSGLMKGTSTGAPITLKIINKDHKNWHNKQIKAMTIPRPGHADLTGTLKYNHSDLRLTLERASARETASRVAVGALCKQFLNHFGIHIGSYVTAIGSIQIDQKLDANYVNHFKTAESNDLRCPDNHTTQKMQDEINQCIKQKDTLGGIIEVIALNVPPGLGSHVHYDRRLDGVLMGLMGSIQAIKGVEIGPAFDNAQKQGSLVHDEIHLDTHDHITRQTNRSGGLEGGISTGEPIVLRLAMKPISTVLKSLQSVDLATGETAQTHYERSDFCAVPRACVVAEAMLAFGLTQALLEKLGGDHLTEIKERFDKLPRGGLSDFNIDAQRWTF